MVIVVMVFVVTNVMVTMVVAVMITVVIVPFPLVLVVRVDHGGVKRDGKARCSGVKVRFRGRNESCWCVWCSS